ncbi:MAG: 23S rRNA pseudouridine(1911/1915/1917) synthase RluD [Pseudomonadota bacterium]
MKDTIDRSGTVPEQFSGQRLDQVAAELFPEYSRSRLQSWIRSGELWVEGRSCKPRDKVRVGDQLLLRAEPAPEVKWRPQSISLDIIYQDSDVVVLNKPAGLVVHPAAGHADGTLVNALLAHAPQLSKLPRAGIVHRLDMDTSGLLVVAASLEAHAQLVAQLQERTVKREYTAVCIGAMTGGGTVDEPIGRHPKARKKMAVLPTGGKQAVTHYRIERKYGHHTRIAVTLETGRTHQIRVHMAYKRFPLIGDPLYGGRPRIPKSASPELVETLRAFPRQALHARALGFKHPISGEDMYFESPLPTDFVQLLAVLDREDPLA